LLRRDDASGRCHVVSQRARLLYRSGVCKNRLDELLLYDNNIIKNNWQPYFAPRLETNLQRWNNESHKSLKARYQISVSTYCFYFYDILFLLSLSPKIMVISCFLYVGGGGTVGWNAFVCVARTGS